MEEKRFNLLYVSISSFWKTACIKPYLHHDIIFKYLNRMMPIDIHIALPMPGENYLRQYLETGRDSRIMTSWKSLPFYVYPDLYTGQVDGMVINGSGTANEHVCADGTILPKELIADYIVNQALQCKQNGCPIILFDPDNFVCSLDGNSSGHRWINDRTNYTARVYDLCKDYEKFTLASPLECGTDMHHPSEIFIPYTLDKEIDVPIKPLSERNYFTKYVGSNYYRDHFVEYFDKCSEMGKTLVAGAGWTGYHKSYPNIEWKRKFPLTAENMYDFYSDSQIGLYGSPPALVNRGHYTLRVRDFYESGVFIVPEAYDHYIKSICIPDYFYTISQLKSGVKFGEGLSDDDYENIVRKQREVLVKKFDAEQYAEIFAEKLSK